MKTSFLQPPQGRCAYQRGLTIQGLIMALVLIGVVAFIGLRLFPLYSEKFRVDGMLESIGSEEGAEKMTNTQIYKTFIRNANIEGIDRFNKTNLKTYLVINKPKKPKKLKTMVMTYELRGNMFGDLDVVLKYNRTVELSGEAK